MLWYIVHYVQIQRSTRSDIQTGTRFQRPKTDTKIRLPTGHIDDRMTFCRRQRVRGITPANRLANGVTGVGAVSRRLFGPIWTVGKKRGYVFLSVPPAKEGHNQNRLAKP